MTNGAPFPPEAYSYDSPIDPKAVAAIQREADKKIEAQEWTVIEVIEKDMSRIERSNEKYNRAVEKQAIDPDIDRRWNGECWFYPQEVDEALDAARLAIEEYYNGDREGDRERAKRWLLNAVEANKDKK